jgi:MFS family permease
MPISGRLADRLGGGIVSVFGLLVMTAATVPLAVVTADTPHAVTSAILFVRGVGQGFSAMPAMAAAYQTISKAAVPRATPTLNVMQRIGASLGTAALAVVLEDQAKTTVPGEFATGSVAQVPETVRVRIATPLAHAFDHAFWWAVAFTVVALVPAIVLTVASRRRTTSRLGDQAPVRPHPTHLALH